MTAEIPADLASALADRYTLRRVLGRGGMATVYLAADKKHYRDVALKVLLPGLAAYLGPERFLKEIQIAARLAHPHILALHDSGEAGGFLYYVMPYIEGGSLRQQLEGPPRRALSQQQAFAIAEPVADALTYAHRMGVLHRDIKPENILFLQGHPIVADFGIAKAVSTAGGANLTRTGFPVGTPGYMSPEQAAGLTDLDERTDVYSLAVVVYEILPGASSKRPRPIVTGSPPSARASRARSCGVSRYATTSARPRRPPSWTSSRGALVRGAAMTRTKFRRSSNAQRSWRRRTRRHPAPSPSAACKRWPAKWGLRPSTCGPPRTPCKPPTARRQAPRTVSILGLRVRPSCFSSA